MKRMLSWMMLVVFCLVVAACGGGGGGSSAPAVCTDTVWTPDPSTQNLGTTFTQTSNCGTTRSAVGTKDPVVVPPVCVDTTWTPDPSTQNLGTTFTQTSNCGATRSAVGTKPPPFQINGVSGGSASDGNNTFIVTLRNKDVYLTKFTSTGAFLWEKPVLVTSDWDSCGQYNEGGLALMGDYVYLICIQDTHNWVGPLPGKVWFKKIAKTSGEIAVEKILGSKDGTATGPVVDEATGTMYSVYSPSIEYLIRIDQDGVILNGVADRQPTEQFHGITVVAPDGVYEVGTNMQSGSFNRIHVVKFSKDLTTRLWEAQYRNFADSDKLDWPISAAMSDTGTLIVKGYLDYGTYYPIPITLEFDSKNNVINVL